MCALKCVCGVGVAIGVFSPHPQSNGSMQWNIALCPYQLPTSNFQHPTSNNKQQTTDNKQQATNINDIHKITTSTQTCVLSNTHTHLSCRRPIVRQSVDVGSNLLANDSYTKTVIDNRLEVSNNGKDSHRNSIEQPAIKKRGT